MSLVESVANVIVGYGVAVVTQILIFPVFGLRTTLAQNLQMGLVFTVVSVGRSFALRRVFEAVRVRSMKREAIVEPSDDCRAGSSGRSTNITRSDVLSDRTFVRARGSIGDRLV